MHDLIFQTFGLGTFVGLDVDIPADQLRRQPHVLGALAERQLGLFRRHMNHQFAPGVVDFDRLDRGRLQRIGGILLDIVAPGDDVDPLHPELLGDLLDPGAAHSDAGADRIDAVVGRHHRNLAAAAGFAGDAHDLDRAVVDFTDFALEQCAHEVRMAARDDQARPGGFGVDLEQHRMDVFAGHVLFAGNLVLGTEHAFGFLEGDD
ncbi:hypothetical protein SDC9_80734 [bioreactor metagenome]|uniref:Uncharacterized protein n=1 Tax=bioreactor metagenome TaxID=1076179 RepID=A0A644Z089_9ZZZZ